MEAPAQTMLTPTLVRVGLVLLASTVKPTFQIALKAPASMEGHAQIKSMAIPVPAGQASLALTANTKLMSVTPSPVSMEVSAKMHWSPSAALAQEVIWATAARHQSIGADARHHANMEDAVAKRMLLLPVTVLMVGLDVTVTFPKCLVRQLLVSEGSKQMNYATMVVTVSIQGLPTYVNVLLTTLEATVKAKWTTVKTTLVAMAPPAGDMLVDTSVIVCPAILDKTVR